MIELKFYSNFTGKLQLWICNWKVIRKNAHIFNTSIQDHNSSYCGLFCRIRYLSIIVTPFWSVVAFYNTWNSNKEGTWIQNAFRLYMPVGECDEENTRILNDWRKWKKRCSLRLNIYCSVMTLIINKYYRNITKLMPKNWQLWKTSRGQKRGKRRSSSEYLVLHISPNKHNTHRWAFEPFMIKPGFWDNQ